MDTIGRHRKTLCRPYSPRRESKEIIASARHLICVVLESDHLIERHRRKMISEALWWISEADGKYATRFRTKEVFDLAVGGENGDVKIQHEHVHPRAEVARRLLAKPQSYLACPAMLDAELNVTTGCVVTANQHRLLDKRATGWARYAGVVIYDMSGASPAVRGDDGASSMT